MLLLITKRIQYIEPVITVSTAKKLAKYFRQSLILELLWEDSIEYEFVEKCIMNSWKNLS